MAEFKIKPFCANCTEFTPDSPDLDDSFNRFFSKGSRSCPFADIMRGEYGGVPCYDTTKFSPRVSQPNPTSIASEKKGPLIDINQYLDIGKNFFDQPVFLPLINTTAAKLGVDLANESNPRKIEAVLKIVRIEIAFTWDKLLDNDSKLTQFRLLTRLLGHEFNSHLGLLRDMVSEVNSQASSIPFLREYCRDVAANNYYSLAGNRIHQSANWPNRVLTYDSYQQARTPASLHAKDLGLEEDLKAIGLATPPVISTRKEPTNNFFRLIDSGIIN